MSGLLFVQKDVGVIATLCRGDELLTVHEARDTAPDSLRMIAARCDRDGWKIQSLSTPSTIFRDLQGSRVRSKRGRKVSRFGEEAPVQLDQIEGVLLGQIGRKDLKA